MASEAVTPSATSEPQAEAMRRGVGVFELVAVSALVAALAVAAYDSWFLPPKLPRLATVDLATLYREQEAAFSRVVSQEGVTAGERDQAMARAEAFARSLPVALDELSEACACTVLSSNAIAGRHGVVDLTDALRRRVGL